MVISIFFTQICGAYHGNYISRVTISLSAENAVALVRVTSPRPSIISVSDQQTPSSENCPIALSEDDLSRRLPELASSRFG